MPGDDECIENEGPEPLHELTLGQTQQALSKSRMSGGRLSRGGELEALATRCREKASALRWVVERERLIRERVQSRGEVEESRADSEFMRWAQKALDAYYWTSLSSPVVRTDLDELDELSGCYEAAAAALSLVDMRPEGGGGFADGLKLMAEAQSALRGSLRKVGVMEDSDQLEMFEWVRLAAARRKVYLERFMRAEDLADPASWTVLLDRLEQEAGIHAGSKRQRAGLEELRGLVERLVSGQDEGWSRVVSLVEELVGLGLPPSHVGLREPLLRVINEVPAEANASPAFVRVAREVDRYLATREVAAAVLESEPTAEVKEARRLLSGRSVVLIGGVRRPAAQRQIREALGLDEVIWIGTREHQSIDRFEPVIAREDVVLVLLAIRWSSHSFGEVKRFCDAHGKALVRLPGGFGANQVAAQILSQRSGALEGET